MCCKVVITLLTYGKQSIHFMTQPHIISIFIILLVSLLWIYTFALPRSCCSTKSERTEWTNNDIKVQVYDSVCHQCNQCLVVILWPSHILALFSRWCTSSNFLWQEPTGWYNNHWVQSFIMLPSVSSYWIISGNLHLVVTMWSSLICVELITGEQLFWSVTQCLSRAKGSNFSDKV